MPLTRKPEVAGLIYETGGVPLTLAAMPRLRGMPWDYRLLFSSVHRLIGARCKPDVALMAP